MHLLFVDESGTPPKRGSQEGQYFVLAGVIVPEAAWHRIKDSVYGMKARRQLRGELKWRYFAPNNSEPKNPMRLLAQADRDAVRDELFNIICCERSIKVIASVCSCTAAYELQSVFNQNDLYHLTYKSLSERFQYYLQDVSRQSGGRKEYGIIVSDHRGSQDDVRLRGHHQMLVHSTSPNTSTCQNLIESLFFTPSNLSVGVQLADIVAGAVWRNFQKQDDRWYRKIEDAFRKGPSGSIAGYGLVKVPKTDWR